MSDTAVPSEPAPSGSALSETTLSGTARTGSAPPAPVVSILVISYNTRDLTLACIRSAIAETTVPHEIIVVDNASRDGSAEAIAAAFPADAFPDVRLIASPENLGFSRGNNRAAREARGDYILLLNSDTVVLDHAIDNLVAFAREMPDAGMWGGRTLFPDGSLNPQSCWRLPSLWNIFCRTAGLNALFPGSPLFHSEAYAGWQRDEIRPVEMIIGCFLMTTRSLWERLGGFDESLFMYGDDADLCIRARALGADPHITPAATIIHYGGASDSVRADKMVRLMSAKVSVVDRHFRSWRRPLALGILRLWPFTRMVAWTVLDTVGRTVIRTPRFSRGRAEWSEIWQQRAVWWNGY
jgi:GT2 family glycosyltransferase